MQDVGHTRAHTLLLTIAGLLFSPLSVYAQQNDDDEGVDEIETITVTGIRRLNRSAIDAKRQSVGVTDSVSLDTVGLLPDLTAVQVAQRIPGVSTVGAFGVNNDRSGDNAESIVIRGIDSSFNLVTLDGVPIAVASEAIASGASRSSSIDHIPPSAIGRFEVVKTLGAHQIPQALSGQLNLVTRSAFDADRALSTRFTVGDNSTSGDFFDDQGNNTRAEMTFTNVFGANDNIGFVGALSYQNFYSSNLEEKPGSRGDGYRYYDATGTLTTIFSDSTGLVAARRNQFFLFENQRERLGANAKFEFRPRDNTDASIYLGYFSEDEEENRYEQLFSGERVGTPPANQTGTSGDWPLGDANASAVWQPQDRETFVLTGVLDHSFSDTAEVSIRLSWSEATSDLPRVMSSFTAGNDPGFAFGYDTSSGRPVLDFVDPAYASDPNSFGENYIRDRQFDSMQEVFYLDIYFSNNFLGDGWGYQIGAALTDRNQFFNQDYEEGDVDAATTELAPFLIGETSGYDASSIPFFIYDPRQHLAAWNAAGRPITNDRSDNAIQDDFDLDEQIIAPFAQVSFGNDQSTVTAGLRYESAEIDVDNFLRDNDLDDDPNDAARFVPNKATSDYEELLPSILWTYGINDDWLLRAGYGRTLGRPDFEHYATRESISVDDFAGTASVRRGNPDIKPRIAGNYDLSLEYYFDEGAGLFSVALFYKDVQDMIFVGNTNEDAFVFEGATYEARITQPLNLSDAKLSGIELSFVKDFSDRPAPWNGFIARGNVTFVDGEVTIPTHIGESATELRTIESFFNQPETILNLGLGYETERFSINIAYNWVDEYAVRLDGQFSSYDVIQDDRSQIDVQMRVRLSDTWFITAEVQNLTEEDRVSQRPFGLLAQDTKVGRIAWLGFGWTPNISK